MRIRFKLTAAFLAIASLVAAAGYLAQRTGREVEEQMDRLSNRAVRQMVAATHVSLTLYADHLAAHRQVAIRDRQPLDEPARPGGQEPPAGDAGQTEEALERLPPHGVFPMDWAGEHGIADLTDLAGSAELSSIAPLQRMLAEHQHRLHEFCDLLEEDVDRAERFLVRRVCPHFEDELLPELAAIREQAEQEFTISIRRSERALAAADARRGMLLVAAAAAAVSIGLFMSRSIGKPLSMLQRAAQDVGRGRLDTRVAVTSRDEIGALAVALNQMASDLQQQTVSKDYLDNIIRSMRDMLIVADADSRVHRVNPAACTELGYAAADLMERPLRDLFVSEGLFDEVAPSAELAGGMEVVMQTRSGERIPVHCSAAPMRDDAGRLTGSVWVAANISRQKDTEQRLRDSLREKELLLKEVHHRVKNNLQVISSLLNLQAEEFRDPELVRVFRESQARVRSMALIHEQLYRSEDLARIDFAAYVEQLTDHLQRGLGGEAACVKISLDLRSVSLPLDLAIPCGMIVNELVSNSLTHAFPDHRCGEIRVAFSCDDVACRLSVADNGIGMQESLIAGKATSIGLKVVQALTRQIHGVLDYQGNEGSVFTIRFECREQRPSTPVPR
jgi:PAS domain S-box-containing protein